MEGSICAEAPPRSGMRSILKSPMSSLPPLKTSRASHSERQGAGDQRAPRKRLVSSNIPERMPCGLFVPDVM
jgi:hypothetical protein